MDRIILKKNTGMKIRKERLYSKYFLNENSLINF